METERSGKITRMILLAAVIVLVSLAGSSGILAWEGSGPLVIEHTCADLSRIPAAWIDSVKVKMRVYYGHASHGAQVTGGLTRLEEADPFYAYAMEYRALPAEPHALCVHDDYGVTPELFWKTESGMNRTRAVLNGDPTINISMFMWCDQLQYYTAEQVEEYFDSMEVLEAEFPHLTFIYTTGHAQGAGSNGNNRWLRNEQIRAYCIANEKVLYDFADLDAWWYDDAAQAWEQDTYQYGESTVPIQHLQYAGDDWGHTTFESCEIKGRAMWWLMAVLSGWPVLAPTGTEDVPPAGLFNALDQNYPNPFNPSTRISFHLERAGRVRLDIFDAAGRLVRMLVNGTLPAARHEVNWNGTDESGHAVSSGVYFYSITADGFRDTKKMILLR